MNRLDPAVQCPACEARDTELVRQWKLRGRHRAIACWQCGLLFAHPQPPPEVLEAYYAPDGGWRADRSGPDIADAQTKGKGRAGRAIVDLLDQFVPPGPRAVFDFGCGTGSWLNTLQDRGWDTYGLEPSSDVAFVRHQQLTDVPSDERFELLIVYHVLEHVPQPLDILRRLAGSVRPGGYCFVSVPRLDTVLEHKDTRYCLYPPHHIVSFTEACLCGLLARAGFEVVRSLHDLDALFTKGQPLRLRLLARKTPSPSVCADPAAALRSVVASVPILFAANH